MSLPTLTGVGRATADPELRFAPSGMAVAKVNLAFNSRKKNEATGQYEDDKVFFVEAVAFKQLAENLAESVQRGVEIVVTGRLVTESWEDKNGGGKRSKPSLLIDSIGPSLTFATAKVQKLERSGGGKPTSDSIRGGAPADDPWASAAGSTGRPTSGFDEEPPF
ncbi:MAG TPA: single-stranded DNA-binding protein [Micromonosporaceae bacterium]|nr:single-stranded DNA-binding protein [Micromonosporaceae bacterium]